jgi:F0F1-type ATP synthase membrane subunit c/vacuolar-type H+-ATPase subunit K
MGRRGRCINMLEWTQDNQTTLIVIGASLLLGLAGFVAGLVVMVRMPADALTKDRNGGSRTARVFKNIAGWGMIAAGLAMLVLPGPGLVVVVLGVVLADFPGKKRVRKWALSRKKVMNGVNQLRKRYGRPPLQKPAELGV